MGCCLSSGNHHPDMDRHSSIDGAPPTSPPAMLEEETVKEVLSETPVVLKKDEKIKGMSPEKKEWMAEVEAAAAVMVRGNSNPPGKDNGEIVCEISDASEMCSYSESFSNVTAPEKKDDDEDDGVVNQRPPTRKRRAHGGVRGRGERVVARRTAASSPEKRGQVAPLRPVRGRPVAGQPRNVVEENGRKRDVVEGSGRWSMSPVKRGEVAPPPPPPPPQNVGDEKTPAAGEARNDVVSAEEAESLENPVVSLECFIFL